MHSIRKLGDAGHDPGCNGGEVPPGAASNEHYGWGTVRFRTGNRIPVPAARLTDMSEFACFH
jgi:hypothetical protein